MNIEDFGGFYASYIGKLKGTLDGINFEDVWKAVELIRSCRGTVWLIGNGGSASLASHMATDLQLAGIKALPLTDVAAITTWSNDHNFASCFTYQMTRLVDWENDLLIAISGSGNSWNVARSVLEMVDRGGKAITITGFDGGFMDKNLATIHINIPAKHMGISQDGHQIVLHIICYFLINELKKTPPIQ